MRQVLRESELIVRSKPKFGRFTWMLYDKVKARLGRLLRAARNRAQIRPRLARAWVRSQVRRIQTKEAIQLIESRKLTTVNGSWHFSWDIERFFETVFLYESGAYSYVFQTEPINQWAPAPLFTNDPRLNFLIAQAGRNCPFWLLKLTSFNDFLARRSELANQPTAHFPTRQTYPRYARKIACTLERLPMNENIEFFCKIYDQWKLPKYIQSGKELLAQCFETHRGVPKEWMFIHALRVHESDIYKGVCLMIEDGRSCCVINIASARGHGRFMLVESVKQCCNMGYSTYDCGVTAPYGDYKPAIYLDRMETDDSGIPSFIWGTPRFLFEGPRSQAI